MKFKDEKKWDEYVKANHDDPYGSACIKVAWRVMQLLDEIPTPLKNGYYPDLDTAHGLICTADRDVEAGGISGFMASAVAQMVFECHERGDEFRRSHNGDIEMDGVVNHAVMVFPG